MVTLGFPIRNTEALEHLSRVAFTDLEWLLGIQLEYIRQMVALIT